MTYLIDLGPFKKKDTIWLKKERNCLEKENG